MTHISSTGTLLVGTQTLCMDTGNFWDPLLPSWGNGGCKARRGEGDRRATGCMGKHTVRPKLHKFTGQFPLPKSSYRLNPQHTTLPSRRLQEERRSFQSSSGQLRVGDCGFVMARLYLAFRQHTERPRSSGRGNWVCLCGARCHHSGRGTPRGPGNALTRTLPQGTIRAEAGNGEPCSCSKPPASTS